MENVSFFNRNYTSALKGLCCLVVIFVHFPEQFGNVVQDAIGSFGYVCVTLFFMVSAFGMLSAAETRVDYLKHFWRNRLISLLVPCLVINVAFWLFEGFAENIWAVSGLFSINKYVQVLLKWCLWFWIIYSCRKRFVDGKKSVLNTVLGDILLISGVVVSSLVDWFLEGSDRLFVGWSYEQWGLVWGVLLYRYFNCFIEWMDRRRLIKSVLLIVTALVLGVAYLKFKYVAFWGSYLLKIVLGLVIILSVFIVTFKMPFGDLFTSWLGGISYEVYLFHGIVIYALALFFPSMGSVPFIALTFTITLLISWPVNLLDRRIVSSIRYK